MRAKRPLELPERLAVLLLEELTDIHAIVQTVADMEIGRLAKELQANEGFTEAAALNRAKESFEKLRQKRASDSLREQLRRLNLASVEMDNPSPTDE